ncbi:amino acid ABC transporter substrate-binding protein (PAAT family) [Herbihabitans rhizosphaerae]|uniref:Amino acid ABC transporter substrate-binding protein (PAAT family) n=1 Tax=Herbihabitans rhizosphaerae TaxID=1872711 RepID=A0A4Q7L4Z8_9PSEU|nr:ABC transporter substrate-binding protein [Herbihabitans rhizosphaerae]RZS43591.1 amino acid ABC transporter substrate-binding protein (PAAT family) [Herbihabitans rhizosphaerae]
MSRSRIPHVKWLVAGLTLVAVAGCGDGSGSDGGRAASPIPDNTQVIAGVRKDPAMHAALPDRVKQAGTLQVASSLQSAPNNFYSADGKTPIGYEVDLAKAIAAKLGVGVAHQDMAFGSLITGLQSGRVDLTMAAMNDTKPRQRQIDFIDYFTSGITIMVRKGNPDGITGSDTLCGKAVAVVQGTTHQAFAAEQTARCTGAGKPAVNAVATDSDTQNQNQLRTGRVAAILNDLPTAVYVSRTAGDGAFFEVVPGAPINGGPYGIGVDKNNRPLADAIRAALRALIADGTYGAILRSWGVEQGAVKEAVINGG